MPESDVTSDTQALKAYLAALEGHAADGLALLAGKDDPESMLRRLSILLDAERYDEAAGLARGRAPHALWCEKAVAALAAVGEFGPAQDLAAWAHRQKDAVLWPLCLVALARHRHLHTFREWGPEHKAILPSELTPEQTEGVRAAIRDLTPVVATVRAQRRILTGVEAQAVSLAMEFAHILGEREEYRELTELLWDRRPLPLNYVYAVMRKVVRPSPELPERLRKERGDSFEAKRLAAFIEGVLLKRPEEAIRATEELIKEHRSPGELEQLAHLLIQLAAVMPEGERGAVEERATALLGPGSRYAAYRGIETLIKNGRFDDAAAKLEADPDRSDPTWMELLAAARTGQNRTDEALELLVAATEQFPDPGLLRKAAIAAEQRGRTSEATRLLERLLRAEPDDLSVRARLAQLLADRGEYARAAGQFHQLRTLRPDEVAFGINEAVCLALGLRHEESLRVYDALCAGETPPVEAVVGRAVLLKGMNRAGEAFQSLEQHRGRFWNDADYLKAYVDLGYASKREREAHSGFLQLHRLQSEGVIEKVLHEADVQELIDLHRRHAENEEALAKEVLRGRFPWLLAARALNQSPMTAYRMRTAPVRWVPEDPVQWAKQTLYATNGYVVTSEGEGRRWIQPISAAARGESVAVDLTALITLSRLGLLQAAASYFGECLYPTSYLPAALRESGQLVIHQPSRLEAARHVKAAIDDKRITCDPRAVDLPYVHEHRPDQLESDEHAYAFADLLPAVETSQLLTDDVLRDFVAVVRRPSGADEAHPALRASEAIRVDHSSLETLAQQGVLGAVTAVFRVYVTPADRDAIESEIAGWLERGRLWEWHHGLWDVVKAESKLVATSHGIPPRFTEGDIKSSDDADSEGPWLPLHSAFLAEERKVPLLVDDRWCQMLVHNDRRTATAAFATDAVVAALLADEVITPDAAADAYLRLISWRFRFLVVPSGVLVALAKRSLKSPPGNPLRQVARYVQDCMRDPGIFGGLEPTDPPLSMAQKLFLAWTTSVTEFVMAVGMDEAIPAEAAGSLTEWALTECLPSPPPAPGQSGSQPTLPAWTWAEQQPKLLLRQGFVKAATVRQPERVNAALVAIARVLGIRDGDYLQEMAEVADDL